MATTLVLDDIDFNFYMKQTECQRKVRSAGIFADDLVAYCWDNSLNRGPVMPWIKTHEKIRFRPGEVTLWSGQNGHGKSLVLGQLSMGFLTQGERVCIASFEMRPVITLFRICRQVCECAKPSEEDIRGFAQATDNALYVYDQQGMVESDKIIAVIKYCADKLQVKHFVIDSLMKCGISEDGPNAFNEQKHFVDSLCSVAKETNMHIHLVAHSRKLKDELTPPGKMDVKGSGSITDQVDNVITVWRNKAKEKELAEKGIAPADDPDCLLLVDKQRNGEWEGRIALWFIPHAQQFVETNSGMSMRMLPA